MFCYKYTAAYNGLFAESGVMPKKKLTAFRITPDAKIEPGKISLLK